MKKNTRLKKMIRQMVEESFDEQGKIRGEKVSKFWQKLKLLSFGQALFGLRTYLKSLKRETQKNSLEISSSIKLSEKEIEKISGIIKDQLKVSQVRVNLDSVLLGGIKVRIGDMVYDDSLKRKINQLRKVNYV